MNTNFNKFIIFRDYLESQGSVYIPETFDWAKDVANILPQMDIDLPVIKRQAKIQIVLSKKNPIYVQLQDGSKLFFTHDEFRRIKGKPEKGKTMIFSLQRLPNDITNSPSQISQCEVF
jgi:hypothetical protein